MGWNADPAHTPALAAIEDLASHLELPIWKRYGGSGRGWRMSRSSERGRLSLV